MQTFIQVSLSAVLVAGVLWWMWRLPARSDLAEGWGPMLALASPWVGLGAVVVGGLLWVVPFPDRWIAAELLVLAPGAIATGVLVLWLHRGYRANSSGSEAATMQRLQAKVGIVLGAVAAAVGYVFVMLQKQPFSIIGF